MTEPTQEKKKSYKLSAGFAKFILCFGPIFLYIFTTMSYPSSKLLVQFADILGISDLLLLFFESLILFELARYAEKRGFERERTINNFLAWLFLITSVSTTINRWVLSLP